VDWEEIQNFSYQVISTFKFVEQKEPTTSQAVKANLVSTSGWSDASLGSLSVKVPTQATVAKCYGTEDHGITYDECFSISGHDDNLLSPPFITVKTKNYSGGSRRQEAGLTQNPGQYTITEKDFGKNSGLEAFFNCEISECIALREIVLVVDNKLIFVTDGTYKLSDGTTSKESTVTNSIISTIE
jgi:hypothetical protein